TRCCPGPPAPGGVPPHGAPFGRSVPAAALPGCCWGVQRSDAPPGAPPGRRRGKTTPRDAGSAAPPSRPGSCDTAGPTPRPPSSRLVPTGFPSLCFLHSALTFALPFLLLCETLLCSLQGRGWWRGAYVQAARTA